jgi:putative transposase
MNNNPRHHHRKSIRLKEYDYANPNWYYITICTDDKINLFGKVIKSKMILSEIGKKTREFWENIPAHFKNCELDYYVVMPNHIHGIIIINDCRGVQSAWRRDGLNTPTKDNYFSKISPTKGNLGIIVRTFKGAVKKWCNENGYKHFKWQKNYYEHIIRNEKDLFHIRSYIELNPLKWELDEYYNTS